MMSLKKLMWKKHTLIPRKAFNSIQLLQIEKYCSLGISVGLSEIIA